MTLYSKSTLRGAGMAWLILAIIASVSIVLPLASGASAQNGSCSQLTVSGDDIVGGSSNCHYVVIEAFGSWDKVCEGRGGSLNCDNLDAGTHKVDAFTRNPWAKVESYNLNVPDNSGSSGGGTCARLERSGNDIVGGSSNCHYVVIEAFGSWDKACEGRGGSLNCDNLDAGTHKVDAFTRNPWAKVESYNLVVPGSGGGTPGGGNCARLTVSNNNIVGGSANCHYVVLEAFGNWNRACHGTGGSLRCNDLQTGAHKVDTFTRNPWAPAGSYSLSVISSGGGTPGGTQASVCTGSERFFDDFDGSSLKSTNWDTGFYWDGPGEASNAAGGIQTYATSLTDPVFDVGNGTLTIQPRRVGNQHFSGALTARADGSDFAAPKGCFEIRARFPDGLGAFPAFWMISNTGPDWTTPGYEDQGAHRPEIDVIETIGQPDVFYTTAHNLGPANNHDVVFPDNTDTEGNWKTGTNVAGGFHTYSARWTNNAVIWYLDGNEIQRSNTTAYTANMFVHLNYALGYNWGQEPLDNSFFNGGAPTLQVDYVKVTS